MNRSWFFSLKEVVNLSKMKKKWRQKHEIKTNQIQDYENKKEKSAEKGKRELLL